MRHRFVLFLTVIAAIGLLSSSANAGCGGCGGCGSAYYSTGLVACDSHRIYVVNQGPTYSGPAIMTYPTYTARSYPYLHGGCGFSNCYRVSYTTPVHHGYRYHHRHYSDHYGIRQRHYHDDDYSVRPRRRSAPRVVYIDDDRRHRVGVQYRGPKSPKLRMKRHYDALPPK